MNGPLFRVGLVALLIAILSGGNWVAGRVRRREAKPPEPDPPTVGVEPGLRSVHRGPPRNLSWERRNYLLDRYAAVIWGISTGVAAGCIVASLLVR